MKEYLTSIGARKKWHERERNVNKGEVVFVIDTDMPRRQWTIGCIVETYPGADGFLRVVDVKTADSTYRRPISRIFHSRPQTLHFLIARRLWGTLRKRSQNLAMLASQHLLSEKPKWRLTSTQLLCLP